MADTPCNFSELVSAICAGNDAAMAQLMEHYRPAMCRVARQYISRTLQTQLDSVDLVQSVQVLLWLGLRTGKFSVDSPQGLLSLAKTLLQRKVARYCRNAKPHLNATIEGSLEDTLIDQALFPVPTETVSCAARRSLKTWSSTS